MWENSSQRTLQMSREHLDFGVRQEFKFAPFQIVGDRKSTYRSRCLAFLLPLGSRFPRDFAVSYSAVGCATNGGITQFE